MHGWRMMRSRWPMAALLSGLAVLAGCGDSPDGASAPVDDIAVVSPMRPASAATSRPAAEKPKPRGPVVAAGMYQVHDRFITIERVIREGRGQLAALPAGLSEHEFRRRAQAIVVEQIRRAITLTLLLVEAERNMTEQHKTFVDAQVEQLELDLISDAGGNRRKLLQHLAEQDQELDQVLDRRRRALTISLYLRSRYKPTVTINSRVLYRFYCQNPDRCRREKKVQMRIIAVPIKAFMPDDTSQPEVVRLKIARSEARKLIDEAVSAVAKGEDFAKIAKRLEETMRARHGEKWDTLEVSRGVYVGLMASQGGLWNAMSPDSFRVEVLARLAGELAEGEVSEVCQDSDCFYLVKMERVFPAIQTFAEAQPEIIRIIGEQDRERWEMAYFDSLHSEFQRLRRLAGGGSEEKFMEMVLDRAVAEFWKK